MGVVTVVGLSAWPASAAPGCGSQGAINGTSGDDVLHGTGGDNVICGHGGNDRIYGHGGNDTIYGGSGNDTVYAGPGKDRVAGDQGTDRLYGEGDADTLYGGSSGDLIYGGGGNDLMRGESGNDKLKGESGNDSIHGDQGSDTVYGDEGNDTISGGPDNDLLRGGPNDDRLTGQAGFDTCAGEGGADVVDDVSCERRSGAELLVPRYRKPYECGLNNVDCLSFSGYDGKPVLDYPVCKMHNCTNYAAFRLLRRGLPFRGGNAYQWDDNQDDPLISVRNTSPAVGDIAQWETLGGAENNCAGINCGHVAYVEKVSYEDGKIVGIVLSESSWCKGGRVYTQKPSGGMRPWPTRFLRWKR